MSSKARPPLAIVGKRKAALGGQVVSYTLKRSGRARHVRLEVRVETGLTVVIPWAYDLDQLPDVLRRKTRWILDKLAKSVQTRLLKPSEGLAEGCTVPYLGKALRVIQARGEGDVDTVGLTQDGLVITLGLGSARAPLLLERWCRMQASRLFGQRANELAARMGVRYNRLFIRGQKTRWGSCSQSGNLNLNWKLLMAPEPVIDYVIIHELTHLKEMNHSKRFWQMVAQHCPAWRARKQWLKDHETELAAILPR